MITTHGPRCDVCGDYILFDKSINPFRVQGIACELHAHDRCVASVIEMSKAKSCDVLPDGPLKNFYRDQYHNPPAISAADIHGDEAAPPDPAMTVLDWEGKA